MSQTGDVDIAGLLVLLLLYLLPSFIAGGRKHHNTSAITVLNLLLGWTVLGWIISLVWAFTAVNTPQRPAQ